MLHLHLYKEIDQKPVETLCFDISNIVPQLVLIFEHHFNYARSLDFYKCDDDVRVLFPYWWKNLDENCKVIIDSESICFLPADR